MIDTIYVESQALKHPRAMRILQRFDKARIIEISHYGEVFNVGAQNFRVQKENPALILALKQNKYVLPAPDGFGIGGQRNYYFSHLLNCIYDCRYCFLQGMYRSANYVFFVNLEAFTDELSQIAAEHGDETPYFFSGYDSDSLALDGITDFVPFMLQQMEQIPNGVLELRTKSIAIGNLVNHEARSNVVVAFSLSPEKYASKLDEKAPSVPRRLEAIATLARAGWQIGLRFDPLIYAEDWRLRYQELFEQISALNIEKSIHSISTGPLRFPKKMYKKVSQLYPESLLFASPMKNRGDRVIAYPENIETEMQAFTEAELSSRFGQGLIFHCQGEQP